MTHWRDPQLQTGEKDEVQIFINPSANFHIQKQLFKMKKTAWNPLDGAHGTEGVNTLKYRILECSQITVLKIIHENISSLWC